MVVVKPSARVAAFQRSAGPEGSISKFLYKVVGRSEGKDLFQASHTDLCRTASPRGDRPSWGESQREGPQLTATVRDGRKKEEGGTKRRSRREGGG